MRSIRDLSFWKATEFRTFLLYAGCVILKHSSVLQRKRYHHFLKLCVAMRMMLYPKLNKNAVKICTNLLEGFSFQCPHLYGKSFMSYNVHSLIHLIDDYTNYGSLDNISCFPFESYLGLLKSVVCSGFKPLQQIAVRAFHENENIAATTVHIHNNTVFLQLSSNGIEVPTFEKQKVKHYESIRLCNGSLIKRQSLNDSCVSFSKPVTRIACVCDIIMHNEQLFFVAIEFATVRDYFSKPINSTAVGIYLVENKNSCYVVIPLSLVNAKCMLLPLKRQKQVAIEILHSM